MKRHRSDNFTFQGLKQTLELTHLRGVDGRVVRGPFTAGPAVVEARHQGSQAAHLRQANLGRVSRLMLLVFIAMRVG